MSCVQAAIFGTSSLTRPTFILFLKKHRNRKEDMKTKAQKGDVHVLSYIIVLPMHFSWVKYIYRGHHMHAFCVDPYY